MPETARRIVFRGGAPVVPDRPAIPFLEGDGTGPDIWRASRPVFDAAVERAYRGRRAIEWVELLAGEKAFARTGSFLPDATLSAIRRHGVAIKGPLTTPIGKGFRSLNVTLRQVLDLYACVRPVRHFPGVPSPVREPGRLDVVIFRENTEDVYAGVEWAKGTPEARRVIAFLRGTMKANVRNDSGIGIKPISKFGTERLVRRAIRYAIERGRKTVTLVHKGNIMKYTEGAFREWGLALAKREFGGRVVLEPERKGDAPLPAGKVLVNDRLADSMFQQVLLRPDEYSVLATPNLNGDYLSDACAAQVGGLGMAPGANIGDRAAVFEATHGTAPKYAGLDKVNPSSVILSGVMMLEFLGWQEAADAVVAALERTFERGTVTYDLHRQMPGATLLSCSGFGRAVIANLPRPGARTRARGAGRRS